jgi:hypothetical protein
VISRWRLEMAVVGAAVLLTLAVGATMYRFSFDVWAGIVIAPALVVFIILTIRRILGPNLQHLLFILSIGFVVKLIGSVARYYVVFDAYGKNADAERYFDVGNITAAAVRAGQAPFTDLLPLARDAAFVERVAALVLTVIGPSRLGGFFVFSTFAYLGVVCFVKAGIMGVPGLSQFRFAAICSLAPSLAFWPSSLGKEAWIIGCLGFFSLGLAKILTFEARSSGLLLAGVAAVGIGAVRPHLAFIFVGAATAAVAYSSVMPDEELSWRRRGSLAGFTVIAAIGLLVSAGAALRYLDDSGSDDGLLGSIGSALERTSGQTRQGGSVIDSIDLGNPARWPYAVIRTLTRPLLPEVNSIATLLPAIETTAMITLFLLGWRRLANLGPTMRRSPFLMYAVLAVFVFGLAFAAVANLGILVRQRSIVVPFVALLLSIPARPPRQLVPPVHRRFGALTRV